MDERWENQNTYDNDEVQRTAAESMADQADNPDEIKETASQEKKEETSVHSYNPYHMTGDRLSDPVWESEERKQTGGQSWESQNSQTYTSQSYETQGSQPYGSQSYENQNSQAYTSQSYETQNSQSYGSQNYENQTSQTHRKKTKKTRKKSSSGFGKKAGICVALAVIFGLVAGAVFQGVNYIGNKYFPTSSPSKVELSQTGQGGGTEEAEPVSNVNGTYGSVAAVVQDTKPSVVAITCVSVQQVQDWMFGGNYQQEVSSAGSGIIVGKNEDELLIATNEHVIDEASEITVTFIDNESVAATVKGTDENDLAVVAVKISDIKEETLNQIKVAAIGDSEALKEGEQVVAIGNALGQGTAVAAGYVSALNQTITFDNVEHDVIQLDIAINHGNSGGALFNMKGELVGINEAKGVVSSTGEAADGMGYAIPINEAEPILNNLMNRQTRDKTSEEEQGFLGVSGINVSSDASSMYNLPVGVYVNSVTEEGPAEAAGIQAGDIIKSFDGQKVSDFAELQKLLTYYKAGETVEVVISRADDGNYEEQTLEVTLASRKDFVKE